MSIGRPATAALATRGRRPVAIFGARGFSSLWSWGGRFRLPGLLGGLAGIAICLGCDAVIMGKWSTRVLSRATERSEEPPREEMPNEERTDIEQTDMERGAGSTASATATTNTTADQLLYLLSECSTRGLLKMFTYVPRIPRQEAMLQSPFCFVPGAYPSGVFFQFC